MDSFTVFHFRFDDEEMEKEFTNFFYVHKLTPLLTNEHRHPSGIKVSWADARSVINETGFAKTLQDFSKYLEKATDNKSYEEAVFKVLYQAREFRTLLANMRKVMAHVENDIEEKFMFNMWNVVWYKKVLA